MYNATKYTKDDLEDLYYSNNFSMGTLASFLKCSKGKLTQLFVKYNIEKKPKTTIEAKKKGALNKIYRTYKRNAKNRNIIFNIDFTNFCNMISKPCHYCGQINTNTYKDYRNGFVFVYNGIDRINNFIGYTTENVVPCCCFCNLAKHSLSYSQFLSLVEKIYFNRIKNEHP